MALYGAGAKAGLIAGIIQGIFSGIISYLLAKAYIGTIESVIQSSLPAGSNLDVAALANFAITFILIGAIIGGLIGGLILGLIFAAVQDKYMKGQSLPIRGAVFGLILFLIDLARLALSSASFKYGATYVSISLVASLATTLIFGYLLGFFFLKFSPKPEPITAPGSFYAGGDNAPSSTQPPSSSP
jgi:MFS family permease